MEESMWPDGAKCCVNLTFNFDAESVEMSTIEKIRAQEEGGLIDKSLAAAMRSPRYILGLASEGSYGPRRGIPRLLKVLKKHDIKGTFFVGGWDASKYPETVEAIIEDGNEVAARGYMNERFDELDADEEDKKLELAHNTLSDLLGVSPKGWRTPIGFMLPRTYKKLLEMGYIYDASFNLLIEHTYHGIERKLYSTYNDDIPYIVEIDGKEIKLVRLPFSWILCDWDLYDRSRMCSPSYVYDLWREEIDAIYESGGFYGLCVTCRYARATRVKALEKLIRYIKGLKGIWWAKSIDVAEWWLKKQE